MVALRYEGVSQWQAVGSSGLHAQVDRFRPKARQPLGEAGKSLGGVVKLLMRVLALRAETGHVEVGFSDVDAYGDPEGDGRHAVSGG